MTAVRTVYIDRKGASLTIQNGRLRIECRGSQPSTSLPLSLVERVVIGASVEFSSTLLTNLAQSGITTVFVNGRHSAAAVSYGLLHNDARRRLLQYRVVTDPDHCLRFSKALVSLKIRGQRSTLLKALRIRPALRLPLKRGAQTLQAILEGLKRCNGIDSLMGCEGAAASCYFDAYGRLFPDSLGFKGRNRRPPRDPVNAILSLTYTILHADATRELVAVGFDPMLGVYHKPAYGRPSLSCDLAEIFRPSVDLWVWRRFADKTLRPQHFRRSGAACFLGKAGRAHFYKALEDQRSVWCKAMRRVSARWLSALNATVLDEPTPQRSSE
ncbi:MAG: CRISPR-associated endonuclease Cas1 1 [Gammaproteobacteria bacterium]|nr:MAG: CRISPR-associated endonuclease Cas1 1 [Gammaproteobacteria bacterium]